MPSSHSGHVEHARVAPSPRTYAPDSMSTKVPTAEPSASQVNGLGRARPAPGSGQRGTTADTVSAAGSSSAVARCTLTRVSGSTGEQLVGPRLVRSEQAPGAGPPSP